MATYYFGEIPGQPIGTSYAARVNLAEAGVHQVRQQGIAGNRHMGCASIAISGGYETDEDHGHEIFYTGSGGRDSRTKKQVADQSLDKSDNAALVRSEQTGLPVRVVRGKVSDSEYAPASGYRYDGLYKVINHYEIYPDDGFRRWMFHLVQLTAEEAAPHTPPENIAANSRAFDELGLGSEPHSSASTPPTDPSRVDPFYDGPIELVLPSGKTDPGTKTVISQRVIRDTKVTAAVKAMYANTCQICGVRVEVRVGGYSEGAHIRPLGRPHHGPDTMNNILCLCPNHHAAFDKGGLYLDDTLTAYTADGSVLGTLSMHDDHDIDLSNIRYHRNHHKHGVNEHT
ncbi:YDG/SRA domain-containing protein [Nocardioides sp. YIM B13467]|uniref:YDG/SRA domain-containing protein n=1 Tax=Nocardioides sp. YIM B13467 TaxID=3366294 RepID=UPI003670EF43